MTRHTAGAEIWPTPNLLTATERVNQGGEVSADVVILGDPVEHHRNWTAGMEKELLAGGFGGTQLWRCQRPAHGVWAASGCKVTAGQYSSANMTVMTRSVTAGSAGSGEW
jgi:hypothetical protein